MHKEDEHVQCPYYRKDAVQSVHCEGVTDGTALHLGFATKEQLRRYKRAFCRNVWQSCMIAKMLNLKYEYDP